MTGSSASVILLDKPGKEAEALLLTRAIVAAVSVLGAMAEGSFYCRLLIQLKMNAKNCFTG